MTRQLKPYIRACREADWIVFLDLRGNAYAAIDGVDVALGASGAIGAPDRTLTQLEERGLLTRLETADGAVAKHTLLCFLHACLWARRLIARGALARAASELAGLKWRCTDAGNVNAQIQKYVRLRPWFPGAHACLFDSLALSHFLMTSGTCVEWVVGVKARPFAAHSWVERHGHILNDDHEVCSPFTEILRV